MRECLESCQKELSEIQRSDLAWSQKFVQASDKFNAAKEDFAKLLRRIYWEPNLDEMGFPQEPFYDDNLRSRILYLFEKHGIPLHENDK